MVSSNVLLEKSWDIEFWWEITAFFVHIHFGASWKFGVLRAFLFSGNNSRGLFEAPMEKIFPSLYLMLGIGKET